MTITAPDRSRAAQGRRLAGMRVYVVTDATQGPAATIEVVAAACAGGADVIQLRRKADTGAEHLDLAARCRAITAASEALLIVNDRVDVAMAVGADGVHLGEDDMPVAVARQLWPEGLIGRSTHSAAQARAARDDGADYLGVGPVHATPTKPGRPAVGLGLVAAMAAELTIPWVAIGGIDPATIDAVLAAGAPAVAVVRAVSRAADPRLATAALRARVDAVLGTAVRPAGAGP